MESAHRPRRCDGKVRTVVRSIERRPDSPKLQLGFCDNRQIGNLRFQLSTGTGGAGRQSLEVQPVSGRVRERPDVVGASRLDASRSQQVRRLSCGLRRPETGLGAQEKVSSERGQDQVGTARVDDAERERRIRL